MANANPNSPPAITGSRRLHAHSPSEVSITASRSQLISPAASTTGDAAISNASLARTGPDILRWARTVTTKQPNSATAVTWKKIWDAATCSAWLASGETWPPSSRVTPRAAAIR